MNEVSIRQFMQQIDSPDWTVQRAAMKVIRDLPAAKAIPLLKPLLGDTKFQAQEAALRALLSFRMLDVLEFVLSCEVNLESRLAYYHITSAIHHFFKETATDYLISALRHSNPNVRTNATCCFREYFFKDERAIEPLIDLLSDPHPRVREMALTALENYHEIAAIEPTIRLLQDRDLDVRDLAFESLVRYGELAIQPLIKFIDQADRDARWFALKAIKRIGELNKDTVPYTWRSDPEILGALRGDDYQRHFYWDRVNRCRHDTNLQMGKVNKHYWRFKYVWQVRWRYWLKAKPCLKCHAPAKKLSWFQVIHSPFPRYLSPEHAGWLVVCDKCNIQVDFFEEWTAMYG